MKRFTILLVILIFGLGAMAQSGSNLLPMPSNHAPKVSAVNNFIKRSFGPHSSSQGAARSGATSFQIMLDYDSIDAYNAVNYQNGSYARFDFQLNSYATDDSNYSFQLPYLGVLYDQLIDANTQLLYPSFATTPVTVDSIIVPALFIRDNPNNSGVDTLIVKVYSAPNGLTLSPHNLSGSISNTVLSTDTILLDSTYNGSNGYFFTVYPHDTVPVGTKFAVEAYYYGNTLDTMYVLMGGGDTCGNASNCPGTRTSPYLSESKYEIVLWAAFNGAASQSDASWTTIISTNPDGIYYPCGGTGCQDIPEQNVWLETFVTIAPPLSDSVTSSATTVCPNQTIVLSGIAVGGTPPYTYSWSGGGLIQQPNDSVTQVIVPSTPISGTFVDSVTVVDANSDTLVKTITITIKGIGVTVGDDTTISCGTTLNLRASLSGSSPSGTTETWTGPNGTLQGINFPNAGAGKYVVRVQNPTGCSAKDSISITYPGNPTVSFALHNLNKYGRDTIDWSPCIELSDTFVNTSVAPGWTPSWSYYGGNTSPATNLVVIFPAPGNDTVILTMDTGGCSISVTEYVTVLAKSNPACAWLVGINEVNLSDMVNVFPNPTTGLFNISFSGISSNNVNISVYDIVGRNVYAENNFAVNGSETKVINLSKNASGIYFVKVQVDGQPYTVKIDLSK